MKLLLFPSPSRAGADEDFEPMVRKRILLN
jgi:hypothetical protein